MYISINIGMYRYVYIHMYTMVSKVDEFRVWEVMVYRVWN